MDINVEFTGLARTIAGQKKITLPLPETATYRDVVRGLAQRYPAMVGLLIDEDGETFLSANMLIINGELETPAFVMNDHPSDGERLVLMSLVTGG